MNPQRLDVKSDTDIGRELVTHYVQTWCTKTQDRQRKYNVILRRVRATTVAVEKQQVLHTLSVGSAALVLQHAMRMCHIVICSLSGSTILFHFISYKRHDFREGWGGNKGYLT